MNRSLRCALALVVALLLCALVLHACSGPGWPGKKKVIVLAFDGMDPRIVREMFQKGELPNFKKLSEMGSFSDLWSSVPPQSPVAWSNFITGKNPGGHAIFDFIHRNPETYRPYLSTSETIPPRRTLPVGDFILPLSKGSVVLKREGKAFWEYLTESGIPVTIFKIPSNFPPVECGAESVSGMGTPDLQGSYGTYQYYTTDPEDIPDDDKGGGAIIKLVRVSDGVVRDSIKGPENTFRGKPVLLSSGEKLRGDDGKVVYRHPHITVAFTARIDPENPVARIDLPGKNILLREGEWSDWIVLEFKPAAVIPAVRGICRIFMKQVHPHFKLYVSPINVDPKAPALPIDTPKGFAKEIADATGYFYTQGMPEDTKALTNNTLTTEEFYGQAMMVLNERNRLFDYLFSRFEKGLFFFYYSSTDLGTHMFWHLRDRNHPVHDPVMREKLGDVIEEIYGRMDETLGKAMARLDSDTTLVVMSDHGFSPFYKGFNLNTWLFDHGYLALRGGEKKGSLFRNVDWSRTRAYALGLNSLYVNLRGREKHGIVEPGEEKRELVRELSEKLEGIRDPDNGKNVVKRAHITEEIFSGDFTDKAPDLIIGYDWGYRTAWESALGDITGELLKVSEDKWSGDHCGATDIVPGILFTSKKIGIRQPHLYDLAPTIMEEFGLRPPAGMVGRNVFSPPLPAEKEKEMRKTLSDLGYI